MTLVRLLFALACLLAVLPARADTALAVFQTFRGNVNFVGTEATLRVKDTSTPCALVANSTGLTATLAGIPSGATVLSAQLYWAGSGTTPDYTVTFEGTSKTADAARSFTSTSIGNGFTYFGAGVDVTAQVKAKGNGSYTFGGLSVNSGNPWCASQGVLGGFALAVVYSHTSEPFRMLNVYEGFQYFRSSTASASVSINLSGFVIPTPLADSVTGRAGHITWEGDATTSQGGEDFLVNGTALTDTLNPAGNQFNSASNTTGDSASSGVDFDIYTLKSPIIQAGQTSATTLYRTGQDMVLLSAEIVAMPYVASADLALAMTRSGELQVGSTTNYGLTVTNNGPDAENGPIVIVDTLPSGLKLVSTSGTGWSCSSVAGSNGATVVTCTSTTPIASGAKSAVLTVAASPTAAVSYTNSASVSGKTGDTVAGNNSASNAGTATDPNQIPAPSGLSVVFTREVCSSGQRIVVTTAETGCHRFVGPVTAGDSGIRIYITAVTTSGGVQTATLVDTRDNTVPIDLMASCLPYSGVNVAYAALTLDCKGAWKTTYVTIPANKPTGILPPTATPSSFFYPDVGRVTLSMRYAGVVMGTVTFVSRPLDIRLRDVLNKDGFSDQLGAKADKWAKANPDPIAFAQAGELLTLRVGALMADGNFAPSFGKEPVALAAVLPKDDIDLDLRLDLFAADPKAASVVPLCNFDAKVLAAFATDQAFAATTALAGALDARVRWYEAGYLGATPWLADYLGTGKVGGPPELGAGEACLQKRMVDSTRVLGRFYPDHFETGVKENLSCLAAMKCPVTDTAKATWAVSGATYSKQPFGVIVNAFAPKRGTTENTPLALFQTIKDRAIVLGPTFPTGTTAPPKGAFTAQDLPLTAVIGDGVQLGTTAVYDFGRAFDATVATGRLGQVLDAPTPLFVRASMPEKRPAAGGKSTDVTVSSIAPAGVQYEDGVQVVAGRLFVGTVFGSELLRLPVTLTAQYWTGSAWLTTSSDSDSEVATGIAMLACTRSFAASGSSCKANVLAVPAGSAAIRLTQGKNPVKQPLMLQAPGRGNVGTVDFMATGAAAAAWLPSTRARATFGLNKSPYIYLREVY